MSDSLKIKPLTCQGCGATVPLGESTQSECPYCHQSVAIPLEYQNWRKDHEADLRAEEELLEFNQSLGRTPTRFQRSLVSATGCNGCAGCLLVLGTLWLGAILLNVMLFSLQWLGQAFPSLTTTSVPGASLLATALVVGPYALALGMVGSSLFGLRKRTLTLTWLQSNLVAADPIHPGGPARCRNCGGTLEVNPGQVSATCYYCRSHNLVALEPSWVQDLRKRTSDRQVTLREALSIYQGEQTRGRGCLSGCFLAVGLGGLLLFSEIDNPSTVAVVQYPAPVAAEFRAQLVAFKSQKPQRFAVELSTKKQKFRLEHDGWVFLGDLSDKGPIMVLSPDTRRYFQLDPDRIDQVGKSYGRAASSRYRDVWKRFESFRKQDLTGAFANPCQAVALRNDRKHPSCQSEDLGQDLQRWTHTFKRGRQGPVVHTYHTRLGVLTSAQVDPYLENIEEVKSFEANRFEVPKDYAEYLSDDQLNDPFFDFLGHPRMVKSILMDGFVNSLEHDPPFPEEPVWTVQKEQWTPSGGSMLGLHITRVYPHRGFDFKKTPFEVGGLKVASWDEVTEVGTHSYRPEPASGYETLIFSSNGRLFRVSVYTSSVVGPHLLKVARAVAERDLQRKKPKSLTHRSVPR